MYSYICTYVSIFTWPNAYTCLVLINCGNCLKSHCAIMRFPGGKIFNFQLNFICFTSVFSLEANIEAKIEKKFFIYILSVNEEVKAFDELL